MESTDRQMEKYNNSDSLLNHQDSDNENVHHITSKMKKLKSTHHHKVDPPRSDDSEEDGVNRIHARRNPYKKSAISSKGSKPYETQMPRLRVHSVTGVDIHLILLTNVKLLLERHVVSVAKRVISVEFVDNLQSLGGQNLLLLMSVTLLLIWIRQMMILFWL